MNHPLLAPSSAIFVAALLLCPASARAQEKSSRPAGANAKLETWLKRGLQMYPEADADKDGVLTLEEARAYLKKMNVSEESLLSRLEKRTDKPAKSGGPEPTLADVKYGPHERNVLDFWKAKSDQPAPVVVFIHGGGFKAGDKSGVRGDRLLRECLEAGVSFAAINYRFRTTTPLQDVLRDCARAIQFIRSKAGEWNVDKSRVASYGGSAGAGTSLWLAFHDDLADPKSDDPVLRESTRLSCAGANSCQFSYDILEWPKLFGEEVCRRYAEPGESWAAFYGLKSDEDLNGPLGQKIRHDCDMRGLVTRDDPPVFLSSAQHGGEVTDRGNYLHHPKHAEAVKNKCDEIGVECVALIPGVSVKPAADKPQDLRSFLFQHLGVKPHVSSAPAQ